MTAAGARDSVTSDAVLDAALTLFAERGYHGTALSQVAEALRVRTPSLYNHMHSKQELLQKIVEPTVRGVMADFRQVTAGRSDPVDRLYHAVASYARRHAIRRREAIVVNRDTSSLEEPFRSQMQAIRREHEHALRAIISDGVAGGRFVVDTPAIASFAIREMCVSIARWYQPGGPMSPEQIAREYTEFALSIVGVGALRT